MGFNSWSRKKKQRAFIPFLLALAILISIIGMQYTQKGRYSFYSALARSAKARYLQKDLNSPGRCIYGNKFYTNWRRGFNPNQENVKCRQGHHGIWRIESKQKGVSLFIPVKHINDLSLPLVYSEVIDKNDFPSFFGSMRYHSLFLDRQFLGLFLKVRLPLGKKYSKKPIEILSVENNTMTCLSELNTGDCPKYRSAITEGLFPKLTLNREGVTMLTLSNLYSEPKNYYLLPNGELYPFPLPLHLAKFIQSTYQSKKRKPYQVEDHRFKEWAKAQNNILTKPLKIDKKRLQNELVQLNNSIRYEAFILNGHFRPKNLIPSPFFNQDAPSSLQWVQQYLDLKK